MGHISLIGPNGVSKINGPYSTMDKWLVNATGINLINSSGTAYQTSVADITSNGVMFANAGATEKHPNYAPAVYSQGSSLSHFDINRPLRCDHYNYVMHPTISQGVERRRISLGEFELMCDLGYQSILPGNLGSRDYPLPSNDDVTLNINQTAVGLLPLNDSDNDPGDIPAIDCNYIPQIISGPTLPLPICSSTTMNYSPQANFVGSVTILYSITDNTYPTQYIDTYNPDCWTITYDATNCPNDICNYICNGTFEQRNPALCPPNNNYTFNTGFNNNVFIWEGFRGSPDVLMTEPCAEFQQDNFKIPDHFFTGPSVNDDVNVYSPISYDGSTNNTYIHIRNRANNISQVLTPATEGMVIPLPQPLVSGTSYTLSFYAYVDNDGISHPQHSSALRPGFTINPPGTWSANGPATALDQDLSVSPGTSVLPLESWQLVTITFTATGNYSYFILEGVMDATETFENPIYIDDIQLRESSPQLSLTKTTSSFIVTPGQNINYSITVCNTGNNPANGIVITDNMPNGINYISGLNNAPLHNVGSLAPGACQTINVTAQVDPNLDPSLYGLPLNNCTFVSSGAALCQNASYANNCAPVIVASSDLMVAKTVDISSVTNGSVVTYTVSVVNQGSFACTGISVSESLPIGLSLLSYTITGTPGTWNGSILSIPVMSVNQPTYLTITALVTANNTTATCQSLYNCASIVSASSSDPDLSNNHACAPIYVQPAAPIISTNTATLCNSSVKIYNLTNPGNSPTAYYQWTLSCGTIISGQGSPNMQADFSSCVGDITITLTITDLQSNCGQTITFLQPGCCPSVPVSGDIVVDGNIIDDIFDLYNAHPTAFTSGAPNFIYNNPNGTLYINGTFSIPAGAASLTFSPGSQIRMATNAKIVVTSPNTFTMNILQSHIAAGCGGMWDGIYLSGTNKTINVIGTASQICLIEDAMNAIVSSNGADFFCQNAVFNKNYIGIKVNGYGGNHPGTIRNSVFTCRVLPFTGLAITSLKGFYGNQCQLPQLPVGNYPAATLLPSNTAATRSFAGVFIDKVGTSVVNPNTLQITLWSSITIGLGTTTNYPNLNVFDYLDYGVYAQNSNVIVRNNQFQNMTGPTVIVKGQGNSFGVGIYGVNDALNTSKRIQVGTNTARNSFYDCNRGVDINGYYDATVTNNCFSSNQVYNPAVTTPSTVGNFAIFAKSGRYISTEIGDNRILNCATGIAFFSEYLPIGGGQFTRMQGNCRIHDNGVAPVSSGPITTQFVQTAIVAQSLSLNCTNCGTQSLVGNLRIEHNGDGPGKLVTNVFNGILVQGWPNTSRTSDNDITLRFQPNFGSGVFQQFGIRAISNIEPVIYRNDIFGNMATGNTTGKVALRAIFLTQNFKPTVRCNKMFDVGQCMVFQGSNIGTVIDNEMYSCTDGLVLRNFGFIGQQGLSGPGPGTASDNQWIGPFVASGTLTDLTSPPGGSILYVRTTAPFIPVQNMGPVPYQNTSSFFQIPGGPPHNCAIPQFNFSSNGNRVSEFERIANDSAPYDIASNEMRWHNKQRVYTWLRYDTSLYSNSPTLHQFYQTSSTNEIGKVDDIDNLFLTSSANQAAGINQSIQPTLNSQSNYQIVNEAYSHVLAGAQLDTSTINELVVIADLCPLEEGIAVYRARTLLCVIFDNVFLWEDGCEEQQASRLASEDTTNIANSNPYATVFPNPTSGTLNINYQFRNDSAGVVVITDLTGKILINSPLKAGSNIEVISMEGLASGIYFCSVFQENELIYTNKIVLCK